MAVRGWISLGLSYDVVVHLTTRQQATAAVPALARAICITSTTPELTTVARHCIDGNSLSAARYVLAWAGYQVRHDDERCEIGLVFH